MRKEFKFVQLNKSDQLCVFVSQRCLKVEKNWCFRSSAPVYVKLALFKEGSQNTNIPLQFLLYNKNKQQQKHVLA